MSGTKYGRRHQRNRNRYLAEETTTCWLCAQPIDMSLPKSDPASFELDHVEPLSLRPELRFDPAGTRPSHRTCNRARGNRRPKPGMTHTSRDWGRGTTDQ